MISINPLTFSGFWFIFPAVICQNNYRKSVSKFLYSYWVQTVQRDKIMHGNSQKKLKLEQENSLSDQEFKKISLNTATICSKKHKKKGMFLGVILLISNQRAQHPTQLICK